MITKYTIKNFRVFDENGVTFEVRPLTILTGCNSAGKSTIVKSMLILKHFFMQIKNANEMKAPINLFNYKIDIASEELKSLGNFSNSIRRGSDLSEVTFEYIIYSLMVSKDVTVRLSFSVDENDELKNGVLQKISMSVEDNVFYSASRNEHRYTCNVNVVKDACIDFLELEYLFHGYCSLYGEYNYDYIRTKTDKEFEELMAETKKKIKTYDEKRSKDVLKYVYSSQVQNQNILQRYDIDQSILDWTRENGSYFWIPVISELDKTGKEDIISFIKHQLLTGNETEDMRFASEKIANDFMSSDFTSFFDYFKNHEEKYFDSVIYSSPSCKGFPRLYDFTVSQDYISMNPEEWERIDIFDEDTENINEDEEKAEEVNRWRKKSVNFPMLYEIVMLWNRSFVKNNDGRNEYYMYYPEIMPAGGYIHFAYRALGAFLSNIVSEALNPEPWAGITFSPSSRVEPSPYYSLSDNSSFSMALKKYFEARRIFQEKKLQDKAQFRIGAYIDKWICNLGIGDHISFDIINNLEIVSPKLHKSSDDEGCHLTDVGFGITQLLSVLITIETQILSRYIDAYEGKGINRIAGMKDLFEMYDNWNKNELKRASFIYNTIAIEEPEIHLHPSFQSKLAEMFVDSYTRVGVHFVIETHSEYLIRKLQLIVAGKDDLYKVNNDSISIVYLYSEDQAQKEGVSLIKTIEIYKDGYLDDTFGEGFFDEATSLSRQLL
jgi:AAA15 family ATPase/GTPase